MLSISLSQLPSRGIPYKQTGIINIHTYVGEDIIELNRAQDDLTRLCIIEKGLQVPFDVNLLTCPDFLYLCLGRQLITVDSPEFTIIQWCEDCKKEYKSNFKQCDIEFYDLNVPDVPANIKIDGRAFSVYPLTLLDYKLLLAENKQDDNYAILSMITKIPYDEVIKFPMKTIRKLEKLDEMLHHGVKPLKTKCPTCDKEHETKLAGGQAIIFPSSESDRCDEDAITFGEQQ